MEGILLFVIIIILSTYLAYREVLLTKEREAWIKERGELLDRIMSRDYAEYATLRTEVPKPEPEEEGTEEEPDEVLGVDY